MDSEDVRDKLEANGVATSHDPDEFKLEFRYKWKNFVTKFVTMKPVSGLVNGRYQMDVSTDVLETWFHIDAPPAIHEG